MGRFRANAQRRCDGDGRHGGVRRRSGRSDGCRIRARPRRDRDPQSLLPRHASGVLHAPRRRRKAGCARDRGEGGMGRDPFRARRTGAAGRNVRWCIAERRTDRRGGDREDRRATGAGHAGGAEGDDRPRGLDARHRHRRFDGTHDLGGVRGFRPTRDDGWRLHHERGGGAAGAESVAQRQRPRRRVAHAHDRRNADAVLRALLGKRCRGDLARSLRSALDAQAAAAKT